MKKYSILQAILLTAGLLTYLQAQDSLHSEYDSTNIEKTSFLHKLKNLLSPFAESEDSGMGVQFFHGEGIGTTRSFYLAGPEATFEITSYHAQGVIDPFSTYQVVSEDGFAVVNGRFTIQSEFPLDETWQKKKSSHEARVMIYNIGAGMYHISVESRLRWRIVVYPYRLN